MPVAEDSLQANLAATAQASSGGQGERAVQRRSKAAKRRKLELPNDVPTVEASERLPGAPEGSGHVAVEREWRLAMTEAENGCPAMARSKSHDRAEPAECAAYRSSRSAGHGRPRQESMRQEAEFRL